MAVLADIPDLIQDIARVLAIPLRWVGTLVMLAFLLAIGVYDAARWWYFDSIADIADPAIATEMHRLLVSAGLTSFPNITALGVAIPVLVAYALFQLWFWMRRSGRIWQVPTIFLVLIPLAAAPIFLSLSWDAVLFPIIYISSIVGSLFAIRLRHRILPVLVLALCLYHLRDVADLLGLATAYIVLLLFASRIRLAGDRISVLVLAFFLATITEVLHIAVFPMLNRHPAGLVVATGCLLLAIGRRLPSYGGRPGMAGIALLALAHTSGAFTFHGAEHISALHAYNFVENDTGSEIYALEPVCSNYNESCRRGTIHELDAASLKTLRSFQPFDDTLYGRMEQGVYLGDALYIGMCCAQIEDRQQLALTVKIPLNGTGQPGPVSVDTVQRQLLEQPFVGAPIGNMATSRILHTPESRRMFVAGHGVFSYALDATETMQHVPIRHNIFVFENFSYDQNTQRLYAADFLGPYAYVYRIQAVPPWRTNTLQTLLSTPVAATPDPFYGNLWVSGLFGVQVLDPVTGSNKKLTRLGYAARTPAIIRGHQTVLVPDTGSGRIYVFSREQFRLLGSVYVGGGIRNVYPTANGKWVLASSTSGLYAWPAAWFDDHFSPHG